MFTGVVALPYMWGSDLGVVLEACSGSVPDLVLAVDCIYDCASVRPLLVSISEVLQLGVGAAGSTAGVEVIISVDEVYGRPQAFEEFCSQASEEFGLALEAIDFSHLALDRESTHLYRVARRK